MPTTDPNRELLKEAAVIANRRARAELLPDDAPEIFRHAWNPYDPAMIHLGFVLRSPEGDKYIKQILKDPDLAYKAHQIANESILQVLGKGEEKPVRPFLEDILQTIIGRR